MKTKKIYSYLPLIGIIFLMFSNVQGQPNVTLVTFPLNDYLKTENSIPFPVLNQQKFENFSTRSFINVMNYGASGDGQKADDSAIAASFAACKPGSGVLFPKGKTFLIKHLIRIPLTHDFTVYADGAIFKMDTNTGYNAIAFEGNKNEYNYQVIWLGGSFDGNKDNQSWPGSPTGNNSWTSTQGNYGLLTIRSAKFALVRNVHLRNTVYDGIELHSCELGVIADCDAEGGASLNYSRLKKEFGEGQQATYFKITRSRSKAAYFLNLTCKGGSIGIQYSSRPSNDSSLVIVNNCRCYNQSQDALHFEICRKVFIYNSIIHSDNTIGYHPDIHISNSCIIASIQNCKLENGRIDFRNAVGLKKGIVKNCQFISSSSNQRDSSGAGMFIKNATHVINCNFEGWTKHEQVRAKYISKCNFKNFRVALIGVKLASECTFNNGDTAIVASGNNATQECIFNNVKNKPPLLQSGMDKSIIQSLFTVNIKAVDDQGKFLGMVCQ